jgi:hypothetical protein
VRLPGCEYGPPIRGKGNGLWLPLGGVHLYDPVIFLEYAVDTAEACHAAGLKTVAVTAGYIAPDARREFLAIWMRRTST